MKSIKDLSLDISEPEYRKLGGFSYSLLSKFQREGSPKVLITPSHDESDALRFGSLVDCLMTEPETLRERFLIKTFKAPPSSIISIMLYIYKECPNAKNFSFVPDELKLKALDLFEYGVSWLKTTRLDRLNKQSLYYTFLQEGDGKIVMTQEDLETANQCVEILKTHPFTSKYMGDGDPFEENIERLNQLKFSSSYKGQLIRCMFDRMIVDHNKKTIQPIDLKTTGKDEEKFCHSVLDWNYYIQANMYSQILLDVISKDEYFKDFSILPFKFIVINRVNKTPVAWTYPLYKVETIIVDNQEALLKKNNFKTWRALIDEAIWHLETRNFDYSYETYMNEGERVIDLSKYLR